MTWAGTESAVEGHWGVKQGRSWRLRSKCRWSVHDQQQLHLLDSAVQAVSAQAISECSSANSSSSWKLPATDESCTNHSSQGAAGRFMEGCGRFEQT